MSCSTEPINIAILENEVLEAIQLEMCPVVDTYMCHTLSDIAVPRDIITSLAEFCDGVITWQTFKCLFFNGPGDSFGLNTGTTSTLWNGSMNKLISFSGCYRKTNDECVTDASCAATYQPLNLRKKIITTWQNTTPPGVVDQCIPPNRCWDPCNKLIIERDLDRICSLHDVMKTCRPTCALTWKEVLRKILTNNPQSLVPNLNSKDECVIRDGKLINGYNKTDINHSVVQSLNIGVLFRNGNSHCAPILINFNYYVYFGDDTATNPRLIDPTIFDCVCGSCEWMG